MMTVLSQPRHALAFLGALALAWLAVVAPATVAQKAPAAEETAATAEAEADEGEDEDDLFEPSNTGYIDSAIIGTRVRIRYDAAFDADAPDRAEFLYGKCSCLTRKSGQSGTGAPGPVGGSQPGGDLDYEELRLYLEYALKPRFSLFIEVPYRELEGRQFLPNAVRDGVPGAIRGAVGADDVVPVSGSGIGDVHLGFRYGLVSRPGRAVTFQLRGYLPTGDPKEGAGTDHGSLEPGVLWFEELAPRWNMESELALWLPTDGSSDPITPGVFPDGTTTPIDPATGRQVVPNLGGRNDPVDNSHFAGEVLRLGVGVSRESRRSGISPVAELVAWYVLDGYKSVHVARTPAPGRGHFQAASGDLIANLKLGARFRTARSGSVYVGYGFALTDDVWYDEILRVEYRKTL